MPTYKKIFTLFFTPTMEKEKLPLSDEDVALSVAISKLFPTRALSDIQEKLADQEQREIFLKSIAALTKEIHKNASDLFTLFQEAGLINDDEKFTYDTWLEEKIKKHVPSMLAYIKKMAEVNNISVQEILQTLEKMLDIKAWIPIINDVLMTKLLAEMSDDLDNLENLANDVGLTTEILLKRIKEENNK